MCNPNHDRYYRYPGYVVRYLNLAHHPRGVHSRGLVHGVAPYIVDRFSSTNNTTDERPAADAYS